MGRGIRSEHPSPTVGQLKSSHVILRVFLVVFLSFSCPVFTLQLSVSRVFPSIVLLYNSFEFSWCMAYRVQVLSLSLSVFNNICLSF